MKSLHNISYPKDFINPKTKVAGDGIINKLIDIVRESNSLYPAAADAMVTFEATGHINVYKLVAECEVAVDSEGKAL